MLQINKKNLLGFLLLSVTVSKLNAQAPAPYTSATKVNYVRTWDVLAPVTNEATVNTLPLKNAHQTTQYLDGLGRPLQTVVKEGSLITGDENGASDLVNPVTYDAYGRETFKYLPFVSNDIGNSNNPINDGNFKLNPVQQQSYFYNDGNYKNPIREQGETKYYSKTDYDGSPLNRTVKGYAAGDNWVGNNVGVATQYLINASADDVKIITVNGYNDYLITGVYDAGVLYKTITTDEQGHKVAEYKDKEGKVILKKVQAANDTQLDVSYTGWLCTYYVYDDFNQLRLVIPPKAVKLLKDNSWRDISQDLTDRLCFKYEYDNRNRMIIKKVPGAAEVYLVYDQWDRVVLTQDGNLRPENDWIYTKYDELNRLVYTGLFQSENDVHDIRDKAQNASGRYEVFGEGGASYEYSYSRSFPNVSGNPRLLTVTFYDDYSFATNLDPDFQQKNNFTGFFMTPSNTMYPYAQPLTQSADTKGLVTGKIVYQLKEGTPQFNTSSIFYDDRGRVIQTVSDNISGAIDINTTQYSFAGQPLRNLQQHVKNLEGSKQYLINVYTSMQYDELGRLKGIYKKISEKRDNQDYYSPQKIIVKNEYDAMGQLKIKNLGGNKTDVESYLESLHYDYNIRGWLLAINKNYIAEQNDNGIMINNGDANPKRHYFGMQLAYDKTESVDNSIEYSHPQLNGNIAGTIWKSKGDCKIRKYDYVYDNVNRLLKADFTQKSAIGQTINWDKSIADFSVKMGDGSDYTSAYDENGNILRMQQWGLKVTGPAQIDDLIYTYENDGLSNRLKNVIDKNNEANTTLGDFRTSDHHPQKDDKAHYAANPSSIELNTITDYNYDDNGNLKNDYNKEIQNITYNVLNLPQVITVKDGKSYIEYLYDATGNKLSKTTHDESAPHKVITTVTKYIAGFIYESKHTEPAEPAVPDYADKLLYTGHEEGRIRYNGVTTEEENKGKQTTFAFDYFVKDHLGNIRMVLTDEGKEDKYPAATLELNNIATEKTFYNIPDPATVKKTETPGYPQNDNTTTPNDYIQKLQGNAIKTGSSIVLKVMAGDKLNVKVSSWYKKEDLETPPSNSPLPNLVAALTSGIVGASAAAGHAITEAELTAANILPQNIQSFLDQHNAYPDLHRPRAYLNWILFDEQFNYVAESSGAEQVPDEEVYHNQGSNPVVYHHVKTDLPIEKNGYLYVYVSNESPGNAVYFDNLQVTHYQGVLFEETHYYPFGLPMAGISSKAADLTPNKLKYNGKEEQRQEFYDGSGLEWLDYGARMYDNQLGRWVCVDPKVDSMLQLSPYNFGYNNPVRFFDPDGKKPLDDYYMDRSGNLLGVVYVPGSNVDRFFLINDQMQLGGEASSTTMLRAQFIKSWPTNAVALGPSPFARLPDLEKVNIVYKTMFQWAMSPGGVNATRDEFDFPRMRIAQVRASQSATAPGRILALYYNRAGAETRIRASDPISPRGAPAQYILNAAAIAALPVWLNVGQTQMIPSSTFSPNLAPTAPDARVSQTTDVNGNVIPNWDRIRF